MKRIGKEHDVLMESPEKRINERHMRVSQIREMDSIFPRDSSSPQSDNRGHAGYTRGQSDSIVRIRRTNVM